MDDCYSCARGTRDDVFDDVIECEPGDGLEPRLLGKIDVKKIAGKCLRFEPKKTEKTIKFTTPKIVKNIPQFLGKSNDIALMASTRMISLGYIPADGISWGYGKLDLKPITALSRQYLAELYNDIRNKISTITGYTEHLEWLRYLYDVLRFCAGSPELKGMKN